MWDETTKTYEISQGIFNGLWDMNLFKINRWSLNSDLEASGPEITVNAIKKAHDEKITKSGVLTIFGIQAIFCFAALATSWEKFIVPGAWLLLETVGTVAMTKPTTEVLKINKYIKTAKEYLGENNPESLQEVLDYEKEITFKAYGKRLVKRIFKKRNS